MISGFILYIQDNFIYIFNFLEMKDSFLKIESVDDQDRSRSIDIYTHVDDQLSFGIAPCHVHSW